MSSTKSDGSPKRGQVAMALLQQRDRPIKGLGLRPAQLFGRSINDLLLVKGEVYYKSEEI